MSAWKIIERASSRQPRMLPGFAKSVHAPSQRAAGAAVLLFFLTLAVGLASAPAAEGQEKIVQQWEKELQKIEQRLKAGNWTAAEKASSELVDEMVSFLVSGRQLLAKAASYRALAEAGLGLREDAKWHWYIAQNLNPALRMEHFPAFGTAGAFLESHRLRRAGQVPTGVNALLLTAGMSGVTAPGPIEAPRPRAPTRLASQWFKDSPFEVEVVVNADGAVQAPVVLNGKLPAKIYLGLQAMRRWRFQPARSAGEPVAVLYKLTDFSVADSFAFLMAREKDLAPVHELLLAQQWDAADEAARAGIRRCLDAARPTGCHWGYLVAFQALAEAGAGRIDEAVWHWHLAQNFDPRLAKVDLAAYEPGPSLEGQRDHCLIGRSERCDAVDLLRRPAAAQPPRVLSASRPNLPAELRYTVDRVVVRFVVDPEGRAREPKILAGRLSSTAYLAVDALRDWRFEPARKEGRPVAAIYELTISLPPDDVPAAEVEPWRRRLAEIEALLAAGSWEAALGPARDLLAEMADRVGRGGSDLLAEALTQGRPGGSRPRPDRRGRLALARGPEPRLRSSIPRSLELRIRWRAAGSESSSATPRIAGGGGCRGKGFRLGESFRATSDRSADAALSGERRGAPGLRDAAGDRRPGGPAPYPGGSPRLCPRPSLGRSRGSSPVAIRAGRA